MDNKSGFQGIFQADKISKFNPYSQQVLRDIGSCHTYQKGYHLLKCDNAECGESKLQYHCCGNRHCPFCGTMKRESWVENRTNELLPTAYYHVVFTLPHELNPLILGNRVELFNALFSAASQTLLNHGKNPDFLGAEVGITMVLHTWGQDLSFHPHVHCIVTGGGFDGDKWVDAKRKNSKFLFPTKSLAVMYKAIFMKALERNSAILWGEMDREKLLKTISHKAWNVYAKAPFGGPAQVIEYLGRYTHKIAITQHRLLEVTDTMIKFRYKDYADGNKTKEMWLSREEFLRRFEQHILPRKFVKIRHGGFLRNRNKMERIQKIRASIGLGEAPAKVSIPMEIRMLEKFGKDVKQCPCCKTGRLETVFDTREKRSQKLSPLPSFAPT